MCCKKMLKTEDTDNVWTLQFRLAFIKSYISKSVFLFHCQFCARNILSVSNKHLREAVNAMGRMYQRNTLHALLTSHPTHYSKMGQDLEENVFRSHEKER